jgi:hypothetical protein
MWVATLHDLIGNMGVAQAGGIALLRQHMQGADSLAVRCYEEGVVRAFLAALAPWHASVRAITPPAEAPASVGADAAAPAAAHAPEEISASTRSSGGSGGPAPAPAPATAPAAGRDKPTLEAVNALLLQAELFPVVPAALPRLADLFQHALGLAHLLDEFLERADLSRGRRVGRPRLSEDAALELQGRIEACPLALGRTAELRELIALCSAWKNGVNEALNSDNNTVSLKKVESYLSEGEQLPFQYPIELSLLRERRVLAKAWLDKLKKSFLKTSRSTRHTEGDSEKLSLGQMRLMVQEGSALYESSTGNKDLKKANEVVREADGVRQGTDTHTYSYILVILLYSYIVFYIYIYIYI